MKTSISKIRLSHLRNEAHVEYHETVNALLERFNPEALGVSATYKLYKPAFDAEVSVLDMIRKSEFTAEIFEQDHLRDRIFRGFVDAVKSAANHFNPEKRKATEKLETVLKNYGNIAAKSLDMETAAIDDLIRELNDSRRSEIELLALGDWLTQLHAENQNFKALMAKRYTESAQRPTLNMKTARAETDRIFREMLNYLEALIMTGSDNALRDDFVKEINAVSKRYGAHTSRL